MQELWDQVESALVGSQRDALLLLVKSIASGEYTMLQIREVAKELLAAIDEVP